jgi:hypothetical protein
MSKQKRDYILFIEDVLTCIEKTDTKSFRIRKSIKKRSKE